MQIGDVAMRTGLTVDAIRFYERERLLRTPARSSGGFRLFSEADVDDLAFIRNSQELGFSLREIRELIGLKNALHPGCNQMEQMLKRKIEAVRAKIAALRKLELELQRAMASCEQNLRKAAHGHMEDCPVLGDISHVKGRNKK